MKVREIMSRNLLRAETGYTLKEIGRFLLKHHLNNVPITDTSSRLLGIITQADIFRAILPTQEELLREEKYWDFEKIEERAKKTAQTKVEEVMSKSLITVGEDTPIVQAGSILLLKGIKQLPVLREDRLMGIVTLTDIIEALIISTPKHYCPVKKTQVGGYRRPSV